MSDYNWNPKDLHKRRDTIAEALTVGVTWGLLTMLPIVIYILIMEQS